MIVDDIAAIAAGIAVIISFACYLWVPKKHLLIVATILYLLVAALVAILILNTNGISSVFLGLWIGVSVFAGIFGLFGIVPLLIGVTLFEVYLIMESPSVFPIGEVVATAIAGIAPLVASFIIFHIKPQGQHSDRYHELTSELSQEVNKSAVVIHAINEGVISVDSKGVIELMNPAAEHTIGWGGRDAIGLDYKSVLKLTDKADKPLDNATDPVVRVLSTNEEVHSKDFYTTTSGGKRLLLTIVVSPIGQIGEGALIVFRDSTKEYAQEREQAEFISTASHEMRTPVASIEGYLGLALNPNTAQIDEKARDFITKAHESAQHLGRLFQDLLDVSRAEDGRLSNHPAVVNVTDFTSTIVEGLTPKAQEKGLRLFFKPNPTGDEDQRTLAPVFFAHVDNDHLREITQNLIENAIKYTPEGDVVVDISGDEDHVRISVQDSGIGIPKEDIPHLFQKFYRVDNTATREIGGTGLGLYLCRRLAEVIGGRIWVESEFKKGSTFHLEMPRLDHTEATHLMEAETAPIEAIAVSEPTSHTSTSIESTQPSSPVPEPQSQATQPPQQPPAPIHVTPELTTTPQPATPAPQPTAPLPVATSQTTPPVQTLSDIEQNAAQYAAQRAQARMNIPQRTQGPQENQ